MRNLTAVLLVSTMVGAGGTLPLRAQTTPATPAAVPTASPAAPQPASIATPAKPEDAAEEARAKSEAADHAALFEAHLAGLHAGLTLSPEQEKLWPPVEQAIRTFVKMRATLRDRQNDVEQDRAEDATAQDGHADEDPVAALKVYSDNLLQRAQALKGLADAIDPLYATLSDDQKHRIPMLLRDMAPEHGPVAKMVDRMGSEGDPMERMDRRERHGARGDRGWGDPHWGHRRDGMDDERRFGEEEGGRGREGMADLYRDRDHNGPPMHHDDRRGDEQDDDMN